MNFSSILSEIERLDPEVYERTSVRRSVIKNWTRRVSLAALPFAIGSLFNKAYGKSTDAIADIFQNFLMFEYIQREFYRYAVMQTEVHPPQVQLIPTKTGLELPAIKTIWSHEQRHFDFVKHLIEGMGQQMKAMPKLDFSYGNGSYTGPLMQVFSDYGLFLSVAQAIEDISVRAYCGQFTTIKVNNDLLTSATRIHSMEARHAAHIRLMRSQTSSPYSDNQVIWPWITQDSSGINGVPEVQGAYTGEQNSVQINIEVVDISGTVTTKNTATEAFDEPLAMSAVLDFFDPFMF